MSIIEPEKKLPKTFYTVLFNSTYIGRASDILNNIFNLNPTDEYRLRSTMNCALFAFSEAHDIKEKMDFQSPIVLESSLESDAIILSLQGIVHSKSVKLESIAENIENNKIENELENIINTIKEYNEKVVIKIHLSSRTLEVQTIFKIKKSFLNQDSQVKKIDFIFLEESPQSSPKQHFYVDLADVNSNNFLKEEILNVQDGSSTQEESFTIKDNKNNRLLEKVFTLSENTKQHTETTKTVVTSKNTIDPNTFLKVTGSAEQIVKHITHIQSKMSQTDPAPPWVNQLLKTIIDYQLKIKKVSEILSFPPEADTAENRPDHTPQEELLKKDSKEGWTLDKENQKNNSAYNQLKLSYEALIFESKEFKKINQQLMQQLDRLVTYEEEIPIEQDPQDKKLTTAMLLLASSRKATESANKKFEELEKNEAKLKSELEKMKNLLNQQNE